MKTLLLLAGMLTAIVSVASAQTSTASTDTLSTLVGKWTGTYDGDDSGNFELILNRESNKLTGQVVMLPLDGNRYPINLKSASWQDGKLSASYTDPSAGNDVNFSGQLADPGMKGTWKANGGQASGTWQLRRADK
ncbi:hypothetical protein DYU11_15640 [Fibrisoma montanum]|uniref:Uncharacterized protein n=1 Tax=Fibrisoma montanum TaxID=2305895 RepID=A0A418M8M7_9BACT|nr:hypothetical protein [Fibrisoma montanum]RIV22447.1 hypothetical protein DYU11_15640 [Fibrisoma montanum]